MNALSAVEAALDAVAAKYDVTVVAAHDVGSRAWNLADADSDYDVGFVFRQPPTMYATLGGYLSAIDDSDSTGADDDWAEGDPSVELHGWNVRRFGELLVDSNPAAFEFLQSPLRYRESAPLDALAADVGEAFNPLSLYHHYRSLAASNYDDHLRGGGPGATVKRNLYVARAALYARYVRDTGAFPQLDFPAFLDAHGGRFTPDVVERVRDLVARKRGGEGDVAVGDAVGSDVALPPADLDPEVHARPGPSVERVNAFIETTFSATSDGCADLESESRDSDEPQKR